MNFHPNKGRLDELDASIRQHMDLYGIKIQIPAISGPFHAVLVPKNGWFPSMILKKGNYSERSFPHTPVNSDSLDGKGYQTSHIPPVHIFVNQPPKIIPPQTWVVKVMDSLILKKERPPKAVGHLSTKKPENSLPRNGKWKKQLRFYLVLEVR